MRYDEPAASMGFNPSGLGGLITAEDFEQFFLISKKPFTRRKNMFDNLLPTSGLNGFNTLLVGLFIFVIVGIMALGLIIVRRQRYRHEL